MSAKKMGKQIKSQKIKFIPTFRNKHIEPMFIKGLAIGYVPEIHEEDAQEITLRLPVGAVKRLFISYYTDIENFYEEYIYLHTVGSMGMRCKTYASRMIDCIIKQLERQKIYGKKLFDGVFNERFKKNAEEMDHYYKNHKGAAPFEPCNDPTCPCKKKK